jgi:hypothetical protein
MTLRPVMEHTPVKSSWLSTRRLPNAIFADAAAQRTASEEGAEAAETIGQVAAARSAPEISTAKNESQSKSACGCTSYSWLNIIREKC